MASYVYQVQYPHGVLRIRLKEPFFTLTQAMSVANGRIGITNRQLGSERLIPLIAGVRKGLPARGLLRGFIGLKVDEC